MWKTFIMLIWLAIPLSAIAFYRADYARYQRDCQAQRAECLERAEIVRRFDAQARHLAVRIPGLDDRGSIRAWQRDLMRVQSELETARQGLRSVAPAYYPASDGALVAAEAALDAELKALEEAQQSRTTAIELGESFADYSNAIVQGRMAARYWGWVGNEDVYMRMQEEIARLEAGFEAQKSNFNYFQEQAQKALNSSLLNSAKLLSETAKLSGLLHRDEQRTYKEELRQRLAKFSLGQQLSLLLGQLV